VTRRFRASGVFARVTLVQDETIHALIAELSAGLGTGQLEVGARAGGELVARYNRRLELEEELRPGARYAGRAALDGAT
jgi:enolase